MDKNKKTWSVRNLAQMALLTALAMIFSYIESLIPITVGIPGVKIGLANLVVLTALTFMEPGQVLTVSLVRIVLTTLLFGNPSALLYSLAGGTVSFFVMVTFKKSKLFSTTGISIAGGVSHNAAQLLVAMFVVQTAGVLSYLPVLVLSGCLAGVAVGIVGNRVAIQVKKLNREVL